MKLTATVSRPSVLFPALFGLALVMSPACVDEGSPELGEQSAKIAGSGGLPATGFDGLCSIDVDPPNDEQGNMREDFKCSCTLLAPNLVLASARCLFDADRQVSNDRLGVFFGLDSSEGPFIVSEAEVHRYYDDENPTLNQLAFLTLNGMTGMPAAVPTEVPAALYEQTLPATFSDMMVALVGYGESVDNMADFGTRRSVDVDVIALNDNLITAGTNELTTCLGDSGGPVFADFGQGQQMVGMTARQFSCDNGAARLRIDKHLATFLIPYIDRVSGNCPADSTCTMTGCRTPDPDCVGNECQWSGNEATGCEEDCPTRDWDCPIGSFTGEQCTKDGDCEEGGRCVIAADDDSFLYCSRPCDPNVMTPCPPNMQCVDVAGANECVFDSPSPGSQGFPCSLNTECRSDICEEGICVFPCTPGAGECGPDFECGPSQVANGVNVCLGEVFSGGGGFCSTTGSGKGTAGLLVLVAIGFALRRRRRGTNV